ncbi:MAG: hypothetical protein DYG88_11920 [Chloroflexi bacterium CFX4]|nr:hypothetical protein [Chloroflexi bacterium CFX4]MDL1923081.1 hypothetical protein [Chloroflexi bacterium CFX3]
MLTKEQLQALKQTDTSQIYRLLGEATATRDILFLLENLGPLPKAPMSPRTSGGLTQPLIACIALCFCWNGATALFATIHTLAIWCLVRLAAASARALLVLSGIPA